MRDFDLQNHLNGMEERIIGRIDRVDDRLNATIDRVADVEGRVESLEEKAGWVRAGVGTAIAGGITGIIIASKDFFFNLLGGKPPAP